MGKKIFKISVCVPELDYVVQSDYNNFPWELVESAESVEEFEIALRGLKAQV